MAVWKALFMNHISKLSSPEFVLTSLHPAPEGTSPVPYAPRLRYCIFRGMYGELPENPHNPAPMNEHVYESDLPTFTTDVRMEKVPDIFATSAGHGSVSQSQGSGGGGPVEAVFWVKEVMTQWRLRGEAFVIGPDIEGEGEGSSGVRTVKSELAKRMRLVKEGREAEWSWGRELTAHFGNMSPAMRGTFKNPPPGTLVSKPVSDSRLSLGQVVHDLQDPVARSNFRVVVIKPSVVEQLDLSAPDTARRWRFTFAGEQGPTSSDSGEMIGDWLREELWP